jgi:hypothetical protein
LRLARQFNYIIFNIYFIKDDPRPPTKNFDIVEDGNDAMIQKLSDWADQGGAMRKLIKASPELFNNKESGFVKSQVRYVRTLHCIQVIKMNENIVLKEIN